MANDIAKAYVQIIPSADGISGSISSVLNPEATSAGLLGGTTLGNGVVSNFSKILKAGGITAAITAVVKALSSCVSEASEFDSGMSQVAATMGTTTSEISELTDYAKEMGRTTAFSATEAAEGLNTLAMAGLDADEQMEVLPSVLNLASAGCISLDDSASYVTGTIKGFGDSMDNAEYYADLMAKGATLANTSVGDLGAAMSGSAATASSYGQSADSVTLSLLRLAEQNVTGTEATTALNRAMADLYTPTAAAKEALDKLEVSAYEADGTARDFNDVVDDLAYAMSDMSDEERKAYEDTIFTTQGMQAFDKMTSSTTETVDGFKSALADCSGSAMQQADTQMDNLKGDVTLFKSAMSGLKTEVGEALTPALRGVTQFATGCVNAFTDVISGERTIPEVFNDMCQKISEKAFGEDWEGMGAFISNHIVDPLKNMASNALEHVNSFCQNIKEKIQGVDWANLGTQISEKITNGLEKLREGAQKIEELRQAFWDKVGSIDWHEIGSQVGEKIANGIEKISDGIQTVGEWCNNIISKIGSIDWKNVGTQVGEYIATGVKNISQGIQHIGQFCVDAVQKLKETDWKQVGQDLVDKIGTGLKNFQTAISSIADFARGIWDKVMETDWKELGGNIISGIGNGIKNFASTVKDACSNFCSGLVQGFKNVFSIGSPSKLMETEVGEPIVEGVAEGMENMPDEMDGIFSKALSKVTSFGQSSKEEAASTGTGFVSNIKSGLSSLVDTVSSPLQSAFSAVTSWGKDNTDTASSTAKNFVSNVDSGLSNTDSSVSTQLQKATNQVNSWRDMMQTKSESIGVSFVNNLVSGMSGLSSGVSNILNSVTNTISSWGSSLQTSFYNVGVNAIQGMINGMSNNCGNLYTTVSNIVTNAINTANNAAGVASPSKKLAWTGEMMDRGLAEGLKDYSGLVDDAMGDVMGIMDTAGADPFSSSYDADYSTGGDMGTLLDLLQEYLPMLANMQVVMDTGTTVGALAPKMNTALGKMAAREARMG